MPIGKTVEMWVICDRCEKIIQCETSCNGNVKRLTAEVRKMGWTIKKNGEVICPACKSIGGYYCEEDT